MPCGILPDGMKELYCWRCGIVMPMLDENEFEQVLIELFVRWRVSAPWCAREIVTGVNIALGRASVETCPACDRER